MLNAITEFLNQNLGVVSFIQTLVLFGTLLVLIFQIRLALKQEKENHDRWAGQTTLKYMNKLMSDIRWRDFELVKPVDTTTLQSMDKKIDRDTLVRIVSDDKLLKQAMVIGSEMEHLAAGVRNNVLDFEILNKMDGVFILRFYQRWFDFLQFRIDYFAGSELAYDQLEWLAKKIAKVRGIEMPKGLDRKGIEKRDREISALLSYDPEQKIES